MDKKIDIKDIKPGKVYSFWDDGKGGSDRQYVAMVTRVMSIDDAKRQRVFGFAITEADEAEDAVNEFSDGHMHSVYDYWKYNMETHRYSWATTSMYDEDPQFIVECAIPEYDEHLIYFAPCWSGTCLFSFDIQTTWQSGVLDIYNNRIEYLDDDLKEKMLSNKL